MHPFGHIPTLVPEVSKEVIQKSLENAKVRQLTGAQMKNSSCDSSRLWLEGVPESLEQPVLGDHDLGLAQQRLKVW